MAAFSAAILPGRAFARQAPGDRLNIAGIGIGGMGASNLKACEGENIVALCDVDRGYSAKTAALYPKAPLYTDYREMLEKEKGIDAVVIATPDHTHAVITMACLEAGKHVYCQKPLTHTVSEARAITEAARRYKVVTQMGNQGHSVPSRSGSSRSGSTTGPSATSPKYTRGPTGRSAVTPGPTSPSARGPWRRPRCPRGSTGIAGSGPSRLVRTARSTCR